MKTGVAPGPAEKSTWVVLPRRLASLPLIAVLCLGIGSPVPAAPGPSPNAGNVTLESGEISGARFTVARPPHWNRRILLLAHGYRPADRPLVADLAPGQLACRALLDEGWMVATTSFRRNGLIIADAIADLDALRTHLIRKHGTPERVILAGDSMGGLIVTLMAERDVAEPRLYAGAVAVAAALDAQEPAISTGLSLQPRIPLLFLSNQSELEGPRSYVEARILREDPSVRPLLFRVARDGHANVNQRERLLALRALNLWLDQGRAALPRPAPGALFFDATAAPEPQPSQVALHPDTRGFDLRVVAIDDHHGNVTLNAQSADFATVGIGRMIRFQFTAHGQTYRVLYGRDFASVKRGEWVAFPDADGFTLLGRNFADAAASARLKLGDTVRVRRFDEG